eukprot:5640501-Prymnesium_polylepis.1
MTEPTVLYVDNQGAEALAKDRTSCQRSRHIERRYLKVREWVAHGEIRCCYIPTDQNPADLLTKSLELAAFRRHCDTLDGTAVHGVASLSLAAAATASIAAVDPLAVWEAYFAVTPDR